MHGNVAEFVSDWYEKDYYAKSAAVDPEGPATGDLRRLRGGGGGKRLGTFAVRGHGILKDRTEPMRIMGSGWFVRSNLDPDLEKPLAEGRTERNCEPGFLTRPGAPGPVSVTTTPGRVLVRRRSVTSRLQLRRSRRGTLFTEAPRRSR